MKEKTANRREGSLGGEGRMKRILIALMIVSLVFALFAFTACSKKTKSSGTGLHAEDELQEEDIETFDFNNLD